MCQIRPLRIGFLILREYRRVRLLLALSGLEGLTDISPYYGWVIERLVEAIKPDASAGEVPELPTIETNRPSGTMGDLDFWTSREAASR
jgi:hypothetical protein